MDEYFPLASQTSANSVDYGMIFVIIGYLSILWFLMCRTPVENQPLFPPRIGH